MNEKFNAYNKRITFLGDSITHNGLYIAYLDAYFMKYLPCLKPNFINLGVSSETASGLSEPDHPWIRPCVHSRVSMALMESKPEVVVVCYGINDGIYCPFSEERFEAYKNGIIKLINIIKETGAQIVIMTPPIFDAISSGADKLLPDGVEKYSYMRPYEEYNTVMKKYSQWIKSLSKEVDKIVDINTPMWLNLEEERKKNLSYKSGDGIHPKEFGHWIIAKELLKSVFNINITRVLSFVDEISVPDWFQTLLERHNMLSASWRNHVGHGNPWRDEGALILEDAQKLASELERKAEELLKKHKDQDFLEVCQWKGYKRYDFYFNGREAIVIEPKLIAKGNPWVWRVEFFDSFAQADMQMLEKGHYLVYYRINDMYGNPESIQLMKEFHSFLVKKFLFKAKTILFGFSRGGLYSFNYAAEFPEKVAKLYLDAPVLDIKSWPAGKGKGIGSAKEWRDCMECYSINEESLEFFTGSPIDKIEEVVKNKINIILVAGDSDKVVPYEENGEVLALEYKRLGGNIEVIVKIGIDHHPHSLENPKPIVDFLLQ